MKTTGILLTTLLAIGLIVVSCKNKTEPAQIVYIDKDTLKGQIIADTIIYDVLLRNIGPTDPVTAGFLRYLDKTSLIDGIFKTVYDKKATAYDYFTGTELSVEEIEKDELFSRDAIGKIQFTEVWYFDPDNAIFTKKVLSLVLGQEQFNEDGTLRGYLPVFKVYMH
jgi:hypothetical protein